MRLPALAMTGLLKIGLLVALVPFGSTGAFAFNFAATLLAVLCALGTLVARGTPATNWLASAAMAVAGLLLLTVTLQSVAGIGWLPVNPVWSEASRLLGKDLQGTLSVSPGTSWVALPALLMPFIVFSVTLRLLSSDAAALSMIRFLAVAGGLIAVFGLIQFTFFPHHLLLGTKTYYLDSVTTVFINRNSAATFLGCTILLVLALLQAQFKDWQSVKSLIRFVLDGGRGGVGWATIVWILLLGASTLALLLTKSRAGVASTALAVLSFEVVTLVGRRRARPDKARRSKPRRSRPVLRVAVQLGTAVAVVVGLLSIFGRQVLMRAEVRGLEDDRFCMLPGIVQAAKDAWPYGSGAGTFQVYFPAYRNPDCGIYGLLDKAHNFYLEGIVTLGAPFVGLCAIVYVVLTGVLGRGLWRRQGLRHGPAVGLSVLVLFTLHDLVDFSLQIPGIAIWTAAVLAACCAISLHPPSAGRRP